MSDSLAVGQPTPGFGPSIEDGRCPRHVYFACRGASRLTRPSACNAELEGARLAQFVAGVTAAGGRYRGSPANVRCSRRQITATIRQADRQDASCTKAMLPGAPRGFTWRRVGVFAQKRPAVLAGQVWGEIKTTERKSHPA